MVAFEIVRHFFERSIFGAGPGFFQIQTLGQFDLLAQGLIRCLKPQFLLIHTR